MALTLPYTNTISYYVTLHYTTLDYLILLIGATSRVIQLTAKYS